MKDFNVICNKCEWKWKYSEGGDKPYLCHKCGNDNTINYKKMKIQISEQQLKTLTLFLNDDKPKIISENTESISKNIKYLVDNKINLYENIFRVYSKEFYSIFNEARDLSNKGIIEFRGVDKILLETDLGKTGIFEGKHVYLDIPFIDEESYLVEAEYKGKNVNLNKPFRTSGGPKKFAVYVKNSKGNVIKVNFGDPTRKVKNDNPKAAKSFRARHKCDQKKDRTTPGYWSCNVGRYKKLLGLKSSSKW